MGFEALAGFDAAVGRLLSAGVPGPLTPALWLATIAGDAPVMVTLTIGAVILLACASRRREAFVLASVMALEPLIATALKLLFARPRPSVAGMLIAPPSGSAFPSGHAMAAASCLGLLAVLALREVWPARGRVAAAGAAAAVIALIGVSRVHLGVHHASDVVAGWLVGGLLVAAGAGALTLWERARGPVVRRASGPRARRWLVALAVACAVAWLLMLARQAGIDPLV